MKYLTLIIVAAVFALPLTSFAEPTVSITFHNNNAVGFQGKMDSQAGASINSCSAGGWCAKTQILTQGTSSEISSGSSAPFPATFNAYVQAINGLTGKPRGSVVMCAPEKIIKPGGSYDVIVTSPGDELVCSISK